jgi:hypothetical protein
MTRVGPFSIPMPWRIDADGSGTAGPRAYDSSSHPTQIDITPHFQRNPVGFVPTDIKKHNEFAFYFIRRLWLLTLPSKK